MNRNIASLAAIAQKKQRNIIGLMSGTSVDGLDIAFCKISGSGHESTIELKAFETIPYTPDFKAEIKEVFSKKLVDFEKLTLLNPWVALQQSKIILEFLKKNNINTELIFRLTIC